MKIGSLAEEDIRKFLINQYLMETFTDNNEVLLDLGCGEKPYKKIYERYFRSSFGIDILECLHDKSQIEIFGKAETLPFKSESFDTILCTEVLEHIENPFNALQEIYRVLKKNGTLILTVPFMVPLHEQPYDFYRFTPFSIEMLINKAGIIMRDIIPIGESLLVTFSFLNQIYLKIWLYISKLLKLKILYSIWNPFILVFSYFPQKFYAIQARKTFLTQKGLIYRWYKKMNYTCKGFFILANKNSR